MDLVFYIDRGHLRAGAGRLLINTGIKVNDNLWDKKKKKIIGNDQVTVQTNLLLEKWKSEFALWSINQRLIGKAATAQSVREALYLIIKGEVPLPPDEHKKKAYAKGQDFTAYFVTYVDTIKKQRKSDANQFVQAMRVWQELYPTVNATAITPIHLERYVEAAFGGGRNSTTVAGLVKKVRNVMRRAIEDGYAVNATLLTTHRARVKDSIQDFIYLTIEQIEAIDQVADARLTYTQQVARDLFLLGCCTGLRVSDYKILHLSNIEQRPYGQCIVKEPKKTGAKVEIPLNAMARRIIAKHPTSLPKLSDVSINSHIKEVAELAGLTQEVTIYAEQKRQRVAQTLPMYTQVYSHTARRSFATNAYLAGLPIIDIMRMTGHSSPKNFLRYIKIDNAEVAGRSAQTDFFK
jgi:integrase